MKTNLTDLTNNLSTMQTEAPRMLLAILSLLIVGLMINPKVEIAEVAGTTETLEAQTQNAQKDVAPVAKNFNTSFKTQVAKTR